MAIVIKEIHVTATIERTGFQQGQLKEELQKLKRSMRSEIDDLKRRQAITREKR